MEDSSGPGWAHQHGLGAGGVAAEASTGLRSQQPERSLGGREAAAFGTPIGNTSTQNRKSLSRPLIGKAGIDGLTVTIKGVKSPKFEPIAAEWKATVARERDLQEGAYFDLGGRQFVVRRKGYMCGVTKLSNVADCDGIEYALPESWPEHRGAVHAQVEVSSARLAKDGLAACVQEFMSWMPGLGVDQASTTVSRIDVCCDVNVNVEWFADQLRAWRYVTRFKQAPLLWPSINAPLESITIGKRGGATYLRIYAKCKQILSELDPATAAAAFEQLSAKFAGHEVEFNDITRVEFEFRRKHFRKFNDCRTVDEVLASLPAIMTHACNETFRLTAGDNKRDGNQHLLPTAFEWEQISGMFLDAVGDGEAELSRAEPRVPDVTTCREQMLGRLTTIAAVLNWKCGTTAELVESLRLYVEEVITAKHLDDVQRKRRDLGARGLGPFAAARPRISHATDVGRRAELR